MNVLAIGAHYDDIELGCGGALAKHIAQGDSVYAYVVTKSGYKNPQGEVIRSNELASAEGEKAMDILGVELIKGHFDTLQVEFTDELNVGILSIVEQKKIDLVYSHWIGDIHHDHQAVGKASLHSCRHVPRQLMYRSNWYHAPLSFNGNFYVDISEFWEIKKRSIEAHESELNRTHHKWIDFFHNEAKNAGQKIGVKYAEVYEVLKWIN